MIFLLRSTGLKEILERLLHGYVENHLHSYLALALCSGRHASVLKSLSTVAFVSTVGLRLEREMTLIFLLARNYHPL